MDYRFTALQICVQEEDFCKVDLAYFTSQQLCLIIMLRFLK